MDSVGKPSIVDENANKATGKRPTGTFAQVSLGPRAGYQRRREDRGGEEEEAYVEARAGAEASGEVEANGEVGAGVEVSVEAGAEAEADGEVRAEAGADGEARAEAKVGVGVGAGEEDVEEAPRVGSRSDKDDSPSASQAENVVENAS